MPAGIEKGPGEPGPLLYGPVGRRAVFANFVRPFNENGRDDDMKHECVHQHSLFAIPLRIASAFGENHAFANDQP
jgi:hypothetical protein